MFAQLQSLPNSGARGCPTVGQFLSRLIVKRDFPSTDQEAIHMRTAPMVSTVTATLCPRLSLTRVDLQSGSWSTAPEPARGDRDLECLPTGELGDAHTDRAVDS